MNDSRHGHEFWPYGIRFPDVFLALIAGQVIAFFWLAALLLFRPGIEKLGFAIYALAFLPPFQAIAAFAGAVAVWLGQNRADRLGSLIVYGIGIVVSLAILSLDLADESLAFIFCETRVNCLIAISVFIPFAGGNVIGWIIYCAWRARRITNHATTRERPLRLPAAVTLAHFVGLTALALTLPCFGRIADKSHCELLRRGASPRISCEKLAPETPEHIACEIERIFAEHSTYTRIAKVTPCALQIRRNVGDCVSDEEERTSIAVINLRNVDTRLGRIRIRGGQVEFPISDAYAGRALELDWFIRENPLPPGDNIRLHELAFSRRLLGETDLLTDRHYLETHWCTGEVSYFPSRKVGASISLDSSNSAKRLVSLLDLYKKQTCEPTPTQLKE